MIINGLVKQLVPVVSGECVEEKEVNFFFGTLTYKLMKQNHGIDIQGIDSEVGKIKSDPLGGLEFVVNFVHSAHKAWTIIFSKDEVITINGLWLAIDIMGADKFTEIMTAGMEQYGKVTAEKDPKTPSPSMG